MNRQHWYCILSAEESSAFHFWIFLTPLTKTRAEWQRWLILTRHTAGLQRTTRRKTRESRWKTWFASCSTCSVSGMIFSFEDASSTELTMRYNLFTWEMQGQPFKVKFNVSVEWSNNNCASQSSVLSFIKEYITYQHFYILSSVSSHYMLYSASLAIVLAYFSNSRQSWIFSLYFSV